MAEREQGLTGVRARRCVPFVLIAKERSGSNLLMSLLGSHPNIVMGGELFNPRTMREGFVAWPDLSPEEMAAANEARMRDKVEFLAAILQSSAVPGVGAVGFKLMYHHAERSPEVMDYLLSKAGFHFVHLRRLNILAQYVSHLQAVATDRWELRDGDREHAPPKVRVDPDDMVREFLFTETIQRSTMELLSDRTVHEVTYEELAAEPQETANRVAEFLGLEPAPGLSTNYRKSGASDLRDVIANYEEVRSRLKRWSGFLDID